MSRVLLPVITAKSELRMSHLRDAEAEHVADARRLPLEDLAREVRRLGLLSRNAKVGASLDLPVGHTCRPTAVCGDVCYAARSGAPAAWGKSLRKRARNLAFITRAATLEVVEQIEREHARWARYFERARGVRLDYLRIAGTGDLVPELVPVIDLFAERNPATSVWVVTRRFALAAEITPRPNLFVQLSVDASTSAADLALAHTLVAANSRTYTSFLRTQADDDARGAAIIFPQKRAAGLPATPRDCPADAGRLELGNIRGMGGTACARCRRCFAEPTLVTQRRLLAVPEARSVVPARDGAKVRVA